MEVFMKAQKQGKRILVAYYSRSGNTREVAKLIQKTVGGDIFEIKTLEAYPKRYGELKELSKRELRENVRPALTGRFCNTDSYDIVFLGYQNIWGTMPMPVFSFLEFYDMSNKVIMPFCTYDISGCGRSLKDIQAAAPNAIVQEGLAIKSEHLSHAQIEINDWLKRSASRIIRKKIFSIRRPISYSLQRSYRVKHFV
jgi:flavodoxin